MNLGMGLFLSGSRQVAVPVVAPVLASTLDFGRLTKAASGGTPIATSSTSITAASINSGTNSNHWQITSAGIITPSATGVAAGLSASYTLNVTATNAAGSSTGSITINTEANAYDIGATDATTATAQMSAATTALGTATVATFIYFREGANATYAKAWFESKSHSALVTVKARTRRTATISGLGNTSTYRFTNPNNFAFDGMIFSANFLRNSSGPNALLLWENTIGFVDFYDCEIKGDLANMTPGYHFRSFVNVSSVVATDMNNADIRFRNCDVHGLERLLLISNARNDATPGPKLTVTDCDLWDMGMDGLYVANYWQTFTATGNYIHAPYVDEKRVQVWGTSPYVWKRTGAWDAAANGKKFFSVFKVDFGWNTDGQVRVLYAEGGATTPTVKVWRDATCNINAQFLDNGGATVCTLTSASTYGLTGAPQILIAISIDTDRDAQMHIWCESDGGGGSWVESLSASTSGQTLNLTAGSISFNGLYDGTQSGSSTGSYVYWRRLAVWYGQAPNLSSVRSSFISDTTGFDAAWSAFSGTYGTPIVYQEGNFTTWNTSGNLGTGGQWTTKTGSITIDHGDLMQTALNSTVVGSVISNNILSGDIDTGTKYARLRDSGLTIKYREMQGFFFEDMNTGHYNDGLTMEDNIVMVASGYALGLHNLKNALIDGNKVFCPPEWGFGASNYPAIRNQQHGTAPTSGNVLTNNYAYTVSSYEGTDTVTPNTQLVTPANYPPYLASVPAPTTKAEVIAYAALLV